MEYVYIKGKDTKKLFDRSETRLNDYQSPMFLKMLIYFTKIVINVATRMCNLKKPLQNNKSKNQYTTKIN